MVYFASVSWLGAVTGTVSFPWARRLSASSRGGSTTTMDMETGPSPAPVVLVSCGLVAAWRGDGLLLESDPRL